MRHFSLSQRIKIAYLVSFLLLSFISLGLMFAVSKQIEDYIFEKQLLLKVSYYQSAVDSNQQPILPPSITVHKSKEDLPGLLGSYVDETEPGVYEVNHPEELDYHYAIIDMNNGEQLIFLFDVNNIELSEKIEQEVSHFILFGFFILLAVFFLVFKLILKRALAPMYQLIEQVKARQSNPQLPIHYHHTDDNELGLLHNTIADYSQRIEAFIQREREFTGFASHELRTPVTVIKGALSLLKLSGEQDTKIQKPINRISRATESMEDMIEMLLSLSREQHRVDSEQLPLADILPLVIGNLVEKAKLQSKKITTSGHLHAENTLEKIPAELVLTNLLRNAIQHGDGVNIQISVNGNSVDFTNDVASELNAHKLQGSEKEQGYGLGTMIIERICQQQGWHYQTELSENHYNARITFN